MEKNNSELEVKDINEKVDNLVEQNEKVEKKNRKLKTKVGIKNIMILGLIVVIILLLLKGCGSNHDYSPVTKPAVDLETSDYVEPVKAQSPHIDIPILADFEVDKTNPYCTLSNPETNADKFYLQYEFYIEGSEEPIYTSKMVEAGKKFSADIYNALDGKAGTYEAAVKVKTYSVDDLTEKNGVTNKVTITVN